ncbi:AAA family ATPase [Fundicoccus culcitae]|uniref:ATP-binding protein n=1 Tax=Fundicoccus culcitae TaxID=2969821 RepID=A0ABY5P8X3_9LACT|nr:ATP-binding protein [Fundicoccus culcitae]UUX35198.1 ATP-binding protein [Fundicoccus culcitae]
MLVEFNVKNFLSFRDQVTFSMETGERLRKYKDTNTRTVAGRDLLKNAVIFGPNGSGKSNLLNAIDMMRRIILFPTTDITQTLFYQPFALDDYSKNESTLFEMKFIVEDKLISYQFEYTLEEIVSEKLSKINKNGSEKLYFSRTDNEVSASNKMKTIFKKTRKNKLLLFDGQDNNDELCIKVYEWFANNLVFFKSMRNERFHVLKNEKIKETFLKFMKLADFNIVDIEVVESAQTYSEDLMKALSLISEEPTKKTEIYTLYKKYDVNGKVVGFDRIAYSMESNGTKKMMALALVMILNHNKNITLLVDEFDDSFHLSLSKAILQLINSIQNSNQFIFTSHNTNLLDCNLRVDQIYLAEKSFDGKSDIYSLFDFSGLGSSRVDITFAKRYLEGQFGAMPDIDFDSMFDLLGEIDG